MMRVSLASDHRGVNIKARLIRTLESNGFEVSDEGTDNDRSVDYPDYAVVVAKKVSCGQADRGILICGTGIGMAITANKFPGVRAAACYDEVMIEMCRRHNDVNILCLPGDLIGDRPIDDLVLLWMRTQFEGGRHERRLNKISTLECPNGGAADEDTAHCGQKRPATEEASQGESPERS
jgi:ribose 5-phosphate isomerase B